MSSQNPGVTLSLPPATADGQSIIPVTNSQHSPSISTQRFRTRKEHRSLLGPFASHFTLSIRTCVMASSFFLVVITAAIIVTILMVSTFSVVDDFGRDTLQVFTGLKGATVDVLLQSNHDTSELLERTMNDVVDSWHTVIGMGKDWAMRLLSGTMPYELDFAHSSIVSGMEQMVMFMKITDSFVEMNGYNPDTIDGMTKIMRQTYPFLDYELTLSSFTVSSSTGNVVGLWRLGSKQGSPILFTVSDLVNRTVVMYRLTSSGVLIAYPGCPSNYTQTCDIEYIGDIRTRVEYHLAESLPAHQVGWSPMNYSPFGSKLTTLVLPIRDKNSSKLLGVVARNLPLIEIQQMISSFVRVDSGKRLFIVDTQGNLLASSHFTDPEEINFYFLVSGLYQTATGVSDYVVRQTAEQLLLQYNSWTNISNLPVGLIHNYNLTTTLNGSHSKIVEEFLVQTKSIETLHLRWVIILATPMEPYWKDFLTLRDEWENKIARQTAVINQTITKVDQHANSEVSRAWLAVQQQMERHQAVSNDRLQRGLVISLCVTAAVVCFAVLAAWLITFAITLQLRRVQRMVVQIASMDLETVITPRSNLGKSVFTELRQIQRCLHQTARLLSELRDFLPAALFIESDANPTVPPPISRGNRHRTKASGVSTASSTTCRYQPSSTDLSPQDELRSPLARALPGVPSVECPSESPIEIASHPMGQGSNAYVPADITSNTARPSPLDRTAINPQNLTDVPSTTRPSPQLAIDDGGGSPVASSPELSTLDRRFPNVRVSYHTELGLTPRLITVLLTDLDGFNQLLVDPYLDMTKLMGSFIKAVIEGTKRTSGVVDRCIGDKILCHWNASARQANHQSKACMAAFAILNLIWKDEPSSKPTARRQRRITPSTTADGNSQVENLDGSMPQPRANAESKQPLPAPISTQHRGPVLRIGIASGMAFVGNVGAESFRCFQLLGPLANLIFLLSKHARKLGVDLVCDKATSIQVSHLTPPRLVDIIPFSELPSSLISSRQTSPPVFSPTSTPANPTNASCSALFTSIQPTNIAPSSDSQATHSSSLAAQFSLPFHARGLGVYYLDRSLQEEGASGMELGRLLTASEDGFQCEGGEGGGGGGSGAGAEGSASYEWMYRLHRHASRCGAQLTSEKGVGTGGVPSSDLNNLALFDHAMDLYAAGRQIEAMAVLETVAASCSLAANVLAIMLKRTPQH